MQYWVHIDGKQQGPMQIDELAQMGITGDTYVWREGLEDWVKASEVAELSHLFASTIAPDTEGNDAAASGDSAPHEADNDGQPAADNSAMPPEMPAPPAETPCVQPQPQYAPQYMPPQPQPIMPPQSQLPPCPPTNLAWAIIVTVLCCQILGIIAIVYAAQVRSKYDMGLYEKAEKYSELSALWCQLSIALGLVWISFYSAIAPLMGLL